MAGLLCAQNVSGSTDFEVLHRDCHTGAEVRILRNRCQSVVCRFGQRLFGRVQEVCVSTFTTTPDASAKLMQLREAKRVRTFDDQCVRVRDVQTGFDDRGTDQHVEVAFPESLHGLFESVLVHLTVRDDDASLRDEFTDLLGCLVDRADTVVYVEDLTVAQKFTPDGRGNLLVRIRADVSEDRMTFFRWCEDRGHLADPGHAHLEYEESG